jgi:hypothetical protein
VGRGPALAQPVPATDEPDPTRDGDAGDYLTSGEPDSEHQPASGGAPRWSRRRLSASSLLVIRILLVADGIILAVVGGISAAFVERPAGLVFAAGAWLASGLLFGSVPLTDPYRHEQHAHPASPVRDQPGVTGRKSKRKGRGGG